MRIKAKLIVFSLIIVFLSLSVITGVFLLRFRISMIRAESEYLSTSLRRTESFFYDYLAHLNRIATSLSEMKEIYENLDKPELLSIYLKQKEILFPSGSVVIFDKQGHPIVSHTSGGFVCEVDMEGYIKKKGEVFRLSGIKSFRGRLCFISVVPVVEPNSLEVLGYLLIERPIDSDFADYLKERVREEIFFVDTQGKFLGSTYIGKDGDRIFPSRLKKKNWGWVGWIEDRLFFIKGAPIKCIDGTVCGKILVGKDETSLVLLHRRSIKYALLTLLLDLIFAFVLTLFLSRHFTRPITLLSEAGQRWARGDLDYRLRFKRRDEFGDLAGVFNYMAEEIKAKQEELRRTKAFYHTIIDSNPVGIIAAQPSGRIVEMNAAARKIFDGQVKEGDNLFSVRGLDRIKEKFTRALLEGKTQEAFGVEAELPSKELVLKLLMYPVQRDREPLVIVQVEDITHKREMEEELYHLRKLALLGTRLGSYAHDIKNYLTTILGYLEIMDLKIAEPSLKEELERIKRTTRAAARLSRSILDFSKERMKKEVVNLSDTVESTLEFVKRVLPRKIDLEFRRENGGFKILGDPSKLSVGLYNLVINSIDAIMASGKEQGRIKVSLGSEFDPVSGQHMVKLVVEDNGTGIRKEDLNRIFEPYFTTKGSEGTGLGLYMVRNMVEEMGGKITVESKEGEWTRFTILLPVWRGEA